MKDNAELLVTDEGPNVDLLLQEYKQAGVMPNGWYDIATNQEQRRMIWAGQSPDGKKWDENFPEGQPAMPWNGASDTRVPMVDQVCNVDASILTMAFDKAELRATAIDPDRLDQAAEVTAYLHWMVRTKYRRQLNLETELSAQYSREHGWCVAYVGWEREISKRRVKVDFEELANVQPNESADQFGAMLQQMILDPEQEDVSAELVRNLYRLWVTQSLASKGFYPEEVEQEKVLDLRLSTARKYVKQLREQGFAEVAVPYVCKNQPLVWVACPYLEILAARGTMMLQQARAIFWRRWFTEAELKSKAAEGWDATWIEEVLKTKGNISSWAGALGATSLTGPSTKTVGNTTYLKVTEENNPLIEVVYAYVKKVDEDGVTGVWETIFSPHITKLPGSMEEEGFYAKHQMLDYAHGLYPFVEYKRENIGRALTDTRSVAEVASTWQNEEKEQRDMLFNRAQWDTLPPIKVPSLGGVEYRLGPGAQVPMKRSDTIEGLNLNAPAPQLSLELIKLLRLQADDYFGQPNPELDPGKLAAKQGKSVRDYYSFWGQVLLHMFSLTLQYNPQEITRVTGAQDLQLDPGTVLDEFDMGLEFDVQELNPDYLLKKLEAVHERLLPADAGGVIDRAALTNLELRMLDPRLAQKVVMDRGAASQKIFRDTQMEVVKMAQGNEAEYVQNDPTAPMKLQFLQTIVGNNPVYQQMLKINQRFQELMANYAKNLQMSVMQEQNKQVGKIGVKPVGGGANMGNGQ